MGPGGCTSPLGLRFGFFFLSLSASLCPTITWALLTFSWRPSVGQREVKERERKEKETKETKGTKEHPDPTRHGRVARPRARGCYDFAFWIQNTNASPKQHVWTEKDKEHGMLCTEKTVLDITEYLSIHFAFIWFEFGRPTESSSVGF